MTQQQLQIQETLPVLAFNLDQLKAWATELVAKYTDLVVTEDAIADVKRDMAEINKTKKAVDDARKEAVRRVSEPIKTFEAQIKEVCTIFDSAYAKLGDQVKVFEDAQREEKHNKVLELIGQCFAEAFGSYGDWPNFEIPVQEKWLNKTTSLKQVREDIVAILQHYLAEEERKAALEQAKQDRGTAIETHMKALNGQYEFEVPMSVFVHYFSDLTTPLNAILANITAFFRSEAEVWERTRAEQQQTKEAVCVSQAEHKSVCVSENAKSERQTVPAQTRIMSIAIEFDLANEAKVNACLETLKTLCVNYGARQR